MLRNLRALRSKVFYENLLTAIVPPAGPGNYGDQGMFLGLIDIFAANGTKRARVITYPHEANFSHFVQQHSAISLDEIQLACGAEMLREFVPHHLFFIGADVVDGSYGAEAALKRIQLARLNLQLGGRSTFLSFSFSGKGPRTVETAFAQLSGANFLLRDSLSHERFKNRTKQRCVYLTHDLALLCPKETAWRMDEIQSAIREARNRQQTIVGLNLSVFAIDQLCSSSPSINRRDALTFICENVVRSIPRCFLVMIASDVREWDNMPSDATLANLAADYLSAQYPDIPKIVCPQTLQYPSLIALTEKLDFLIGGRMHLALAAARGAVPAVVIRYNEKVRGFYRDLYGLGDELAPTDAKQLVGSIAYIGINHPRLRKELQKALPILLEKRSIEQIVFPKTH